jgi:hypothetical protein
MSLGKQTAASPRETSAPTPSVRPEAADFGSNQARLGTVSADELESVGTTAVLEAAVRARDLPRSATNVQAAAPLLQAAAGQLRTGELVGTVDPESARDLRRGALGLAVGPLLTIGTAMDVAPGAAFQAMDLRRRAVDDLTLAP